MNIKIEREGAGYGWVAFDDDAYDGPGSILGHGKSPDQALGEFLLQVWDRGIRHQTEELKSRLRDVFGDDPSDEWNSEPLDPDRLREDAEDRRAVWT